jgi:hypothetical protein
MREPEGERLKKKKKNTWQSCARNSVVLPRDREPPGLKMALLAFQKHRVRPPRVMCPKHADEVRAWVFVHAGMSRCKLCATHLPHRAAHAVNERHSCRSCFADHLMHGRYQRHAFRYTCACRVRSQQATYWCSAAARLTSHCRPPPSWSPGAVLHSRRIAYIQAEQILVYTVGIAMVRGFCSLCASASIVIVSMNSALLAPAVIGTGYT